MDIAGEFGSTLRRFPLPVFFAFIATLTTFYWIASKEHAGILQPLLMIFSLATLVSLIIKVLRERNTVGKTGILISYVVSVMALTWYYRYLHGAINGGQLPMCDAITFWGTIFLLLLTISVAPFIKRRNDGAMLAYNRTIFTSYIFTLVLSFILYTGLALAILAIDRLFDAGIHENTYLYLLSVVGILFVALHFLYRYPSDFDDTGKSSQAPYNIIVQYILIPIVLVYALILIFYTLRNIIRYQAIENWTYWLLLWFYLIGFLTYLLNLTIAGSNHSKWSRVFCKWFLYLLIPLSLLSLISVWKDIRAEGLLEIKFVIASFSLYLLLVSVYLEVFKGKDYRLIPAILALIIATSSYGPMSMCRASVRNQWDRFVNYLKENDMMEDDSLKSPLETGKEEQLVIRDYIEFFSDRHALDRLADIDARGLLGQPPYSTDTLIQVLGLSEAVPKMVQKVPVGRNPFEEIELEGFDKLITIIPHYTSPPDSGFYLLQAEAPGTLILMNGDQELSSFQLEKDRVEQRLQGEKYLIYEDDFYYIRIYLDHLEWSGNEISVVSGKALLRIQ